MTALGRNNANEQQSHSFLESMPLTANLIVII
jgi:hypothetical protein